VAAVPANDHFHPHRWVVAGSSPDVAAVAANDHFHPHRWVVAGSSPDVAAVAAMTKRPYVVVLSSTAVAELS
tara:strand:- start:561 stop:776 length:216 start_codon:yes stop_codon:yes gene_type:complete